MKSYLIVFLILLPTSSFAFLEYKCSYDEISTNSGEMPALIVQELPRKGESTWQAYTLASPPEWKPIRFGVFTEDLSNTSRYCTKAGEIRPTFKAPGAMANCSIRDVLSEQKKNILMTKLIPEALQLHSERLMVKPVTGAIVLPNYTGGYCATFTPPQGHKTKGVTGADMALYVAAGPTRSGVAWAGPCSRDKDLRPVIGFANFGPHGIVDNRVSIRTAAHEIAHAIGFDYITMLQRKVTVNRTVRGAVRSVVNTRLTAFKTRLHFNCSTAEGMELENEGGQGTADSHWERRNAKDELMTGLITFGSYYSALTMAFFEDTGFYKANWGMEENMEWGKNAGCSFLTGKCVTNGVSNFPDMFCTDNTGEFLCTTDRRGLGQCMRATYTNDLSAHFQYFGNPKEGGALSMLTDHCPVVHYLSNGMCHDGTNIVGNRFGPSSMCLKGENLALRGYGPSDTCAEVKCENDNVFVRYDSDDTWHACPQGGKIKPTRTFNHGFIMCPKHTDVCPPAKKKKAVIKPSVSLKPEESVSLPTKETDKMPTHPVSPIAKPPTSESAKKAPKSDTSYKMETLAPDPEAKASPLRKKSDERDAAGSNKTVAAGDKKHSDTHPPPPKNDKEQPKRNNGQSLKGKEEQQKNGEEGTDKEETKQPGFKGVSKDGDRRSEEHKDRQLIKKGDKERKSEAGKDKDEGKKYEDAKATKKSDEHSMENKDLQPKVNEKPQRKGQTNKEEGGKKGRKDAAVSKDGDQHSKENNGQSLKGKEEQQRKGEATPIKKETKNIHNSSKHTGSAQEGMSGSSEGERLSGKESENGRDESVNAPEFGVNSKMSGKLNEAVAPSEPISDENGESVTDENGQHHVGEKQGHRPSKMNTSSEKVCSLNCDTKKHVSDLVNNNAKTGKQSPTDSAVHFYNKWRIVTVLVASGVLFLV